MPRKILVFALALTVAIAVAAVAYAQSTVPVNTYSIDKASTTPGGAGKSSKPLAKKVLFSFSTNTTNGTRAKVIQKYDIGFQGLRSYSAKRPKCTFAQANQKSLAAVKTVCGKAAAGSGTVNNFFGPSNNPNAKTQCKLQLRLYNTRHGKQGGLAIRLDRGAPADCAIDPALALDAKFAKAKIGGKESVRLKFEAGQNLRHPIPNFDNSANNVTATVKRLTAKVKIRGKRRTVGLLSSVACVKRKRTISVKFTDESGVSKTVKKKIKC